MYASRCEEASSEHNIEIGIIATRQYYGVDYKLHSQIECSACNVDYHQHNMFTDEIMVIDTILPHFGILVT